MCIGRFAGGGTPHALTVRGLFATGSGVEQDAGGISDGVGEDMPLVFVTAALSGMCCAKLMPLDVYAVALEIVLFVRALECLL